MVEECGVFCCFLESGASPGSGPAADSDSRVLGDVGDVPSHTGIDGVDVGGGPAETTDCAGALVALFAAATGGV